MCKECVPKLAKGLPLNLKAYLDNGHVHVGNYDTRLFSLFTWNFENKLGHAMTKIITICKVKTVMKGTVSLGIGKDLNNPFFGKLNHANKTWIYNPPFSL